MIVSGPRFSGANSLVLICIYWWVFELPIGKNQKSIAADGDKTQATNTIELVNNLIISDPFNTHSYHII